MELTTTFQKIGTGTQKSYGQASGYLELWAKYNSQDVANNKSNVTVELRLVVTVGYIGNYQATYWNITGDLSNGGNLGSGSYTSRTLGSATGDITHNSDGTKTVSFGGTFNPTAWGQTLDVSGSATLPSLHTPPTMSLTSVTEANSTVGQNNLFVNYLSDKTFTVSYSFNDGATASALKIYTKTGSQITSNVTTSLGASSGTLRIQYLNGVTDADITNGKTSFILEITDSMNGKTRITTPEYNFIMYKAVNLEATACKIKRHGQASGEASLTIKGTWFNGSVGNTTNALNFISFQYRKVGDANYTTISVPLSANTGTGNNIIIDNWLVKNNGVTVTAFDKNYTYDVYVTIADTVTRGLAGGVQLTLAKGVWVMAKYKDHVDFMGLTVQKYNPFEYSTSETICGVWNDNGTKKYIYRKVLGDIGTLGNAGSKSFSTSGMNISKILKIGGVINYDTNYTAPIDRVRTYYNSSNNTVTAYNFDNLNINNGYVYIEYIKTS